MIPLPSWDAAHPMIVHFPIALLAAAPLLILIGMMTRAHRPWMAAALVVMSVGTLGAWLAAASGNAAGDLAEHQPGVAALLERHEEMAEVARTLFTVLTLAFAALVMLPWALRREPGQRWRVLAQGAFVVVYAGAFVYLASAAHQGARLVHEMGVHAQIASRSGGPMPPTQRPTVEARERHADD